MAMVKVYGEDEISAFAKLKAAQLRELAQQQSIDIIKCINPSTGKVKFKAKRELLAELANLRRSVEPGEHERSVRLCYDEDESSKPRARSERPEAGPSTRTPTPPRPRTRSSTKRPPPSPPASPCTRARTRDATAGPTLSAMKPPPPPKGLRASPGSPFAFLQNGIPRAPPRRRGVPLGELEDDSIHSFSTIDGAATRHGSPADASQAGGADARRGSQRRRAPARKASRTVVPSSVPATQELPDVECPRSRPAAASPVATEPGSRHSTPPRVNSRGDSGYTTPAAAHDSDVSRESQAERAEDRGECEGAGGGQNSVGCSQKEGRRPSGLTIPPNPVVKIDPEREKRHRHAWDDMLEPDLEMLVPQVQAAFCDCFQKYWDEGLAFKVPNYDTVEVCLKKIWAGAAPGQIQYDLKSPKIREPALYVPLPLQPQVTEYGFPVSQSVQIEQEERTDDVCGRVPDSSQEEAAASKAGPDGSARKRRRAQDDADGDAASVGKRRRSAEPKPTFDKGKGRAYG